MTPEKLHVILILILLKLQKEHYFLLLTLHTFGIYTRLFHFISAVCVISQNKWDEREYQEQYCYLFETSVVLVLQYYNPVIIRNMCSITPTNLFICCWRKKLVVNGVLTQIIFSKTRGTTLWIEFICFEMKKIHFLNLSLKEFPYRNVMDGFQNPRNISSARRAHHKQIQLIKFSLVYT